MLILLLKLSESLPQHQHIFLRQALLHDALELLDKDGAVDCCFISLELLSQVVHEPLVLDRSRSFILFEVSDDLFGHSVFLFIFFLGVDLHLFQLICLEASMQ